MEKTMVDESNLSAYERIYQFGLAHGLLLREVEHLAEGRTDVVSKMRGNELSAAVKAMVVMVKRGKLDRRYFLVCIPGDRRVNFDTIKKLGAGNDARFAPEDRASALTGCQMGSVR